MFMLTQYGFIDKKNMSFSYFDVIYDEKKKHLAQNNFKHNAELLFIKGSQ